MLDNKEIWKDCKGYEGLYQVSNMGRVCEGKRKTCDGYHWEYYDGSNKSESEKIAI